MDSEPNSKRKLKLPNKVNHRQLWLLTNEAGYSVVTEDRDYIELSRPVGFIRKPRSELSEFEKNALTVRLNRILDLYVDPESFKDEIINRIKNITKTLNALESDFIWEWVGRNIQ